MSARPAPLDHPRYEPGEELGRGAQGVVVRVVDREAPGAALVAKVFRSGAFREEALAAEFAVLSRSRIPGLARAHDLAALPAHRGPVPGGGFVDGPEAGAWVGAPGLAGAARAARLGRVIADVAASLSQLHDAGFAHGDLKPAHARVSDRVMLLDLGAVIALAGASPGQGGLTPAYAAPEVLAGARASARADLWGLGALAWAAATGRAPERSGRVAARAGLVGPAGRGRSGRGAPGLAPAGSAGGRAREALRRLGAAQSAAGIVPVHAPPPVGRERELAEPRRAGARGALPGGAQRGGQEPPGARR